MLRATLMRLEDQAYCLLLLTHHIASDSWSKAVLFRDLSVYYRDALSGRTSSLPALSIQYADFAIWQRQQFQGASVEKEIAYWVRELAGATSKLELPTDRPRPQVQSSRGAEQYLCLPGSLLAALKQLARREGVTPFMVLLATFQNPPPPVYSSDGDSHRHPRCRPQPG